MGQDMWLLVLAGGAVLLSRWASRTAHRRWAWRVG